MPDAPVLALRGGRVARDRNLVLRDVDFHVERGEAVVLLGDNGSGKTTLVRACLGLLPLEAGRVELFGTPLESFKHWARIGYVPQRVSAASGVPATVNEVVLSGRVGRTRPLRRFGAGDREAARAALAAADLVDVAARPVAGLSGGQQQRVLIARALAGEPDLLVLDEPVASVDLSHQATFAELLGRLRGEGVAILLVAHAVGAMAPLIDRAVTLEGGRIAYDGPPLVTLDAHSHHHHAAPQASES